MRGEMRVKDVSLFIIIIALLIMSAVTVIAPPTPHAVSGYIFYNPPTQVPSGISYDINDSASGFFKESVTSFPLPSQSGYYSESVNGTDGDLIIVRAWNLTHYGKTNVSLLGTTRNVNVTLNLSRSPEPTVNITTPDNILRNDSAYFTVTSILKLYGSPSECNATITFSNMSVLASYNSPTIVFGTLTSGYTATIDWNVSVIGVGASNITINFSCAGMGGERFEKLNNTDTLFNVTTEDVTAPIINLIYPNNNSWVNTTNVTFMYNVTDSSPISNCSLYLDGGLVQTVFSPDKSLVLSFNETVTVAMHVWNITCYDSTSQYYQGFSSTFNFSVDDVIPAVMLWTPANDSFQNKSVNFTYNVSETGSGINNCSLYINETMYFTDYNVASGVLMSRLVNLALGSYVWRVDCYDYADNYNITENYYFTIRYPDIFIENISFEYSALIENVSVNVTANISNIGNKNASDVLVRFYLGGVQIGADQIISFLDFGESVLLSENFTSSRGENNIVVLVDPPISSNGSIVEDNESNNEANNSIIVSSWQRFYGSKQTNLALGNDNSLVIGWEPNTTVNILFVEYGTSFDWSSIQALGRDVNNNTAANDFSEADVALNLTGFPDSIYDSYTDNGNVLLNETFFIINRNITFVPVSNSTDNANFVTGILWDMSDGGGEYDGSQDLIFITRTNYAQGKYGMYDYEAKIPSTLKDYKLETGKVIIYTEII